ncbi:hypothetical protein SAMN02927923_04432, partial [Microvirga guangxiensis]
MGSGRETRPGSESATPPARGFVTIRPRHSGAIRDEPSETRYGVAGHAGLESVLQTRRGWGSVDAACPIRLSASSSPL